MSCRRPTLIRLLLCTLLVAATACGGQADDDGTHVGATVGANADTADVAVVTIARGLADAHPEVLWHALPPSYRTDITRLVRTSARQMDADVWDRSFGVLHKLTALLRDKREYILDHPMLAAKVRRGEAERNWDSVVGIVDTIVSSDLANLEQARNLQIDRFLATTGSRVMQQLAAASALTPDDAFGKMLEDLRQTEATLVSASGDTARIRVEVPGRAAQEQIWTRVEGHWIPAELSDGWDEQMAAARRRVDGYSGEQMQANKPAVLMQLAMLDGALDTLAASNSAAEFEAGIGSLFGMALGAAMSQAATTGVTPEPAPVPATVAQPGVIAPSATPAITPAADPVATTPGLDVPLPADEDAWQENRAAIPIERAGDFVGQQIRVVGVHGLDAVCNLREVRHDVLVFERNLGGGAVAFEIGRDEIEVLERTDW